MLRQQNHRDEQNAIATRHELAQLNVGHESQMQQLRNSLEH